MAPKSPRIGLALGSGGVNGLAHIGVIKTLEKNNIPIYCITGSSIGALIGALYAVHGSAEKIEEIAITNSRKRSFELFDPTLKGGILKGEKLAQMIHELLNKSTFEELAFPFAAIATDFNTGETVVIKTGELAQAVRASISVPGILQPVILGNHVLADGGLSEPIPVAAARELGADIVIAVNLDKLPENETIQDYPPLHSIPWRAVNILRHHLADESVKTADIIITPKITHKALVGWNAFFNENKVKEFISLGELATDEIVNELKKLKSVSKHEKTVPNYISKLLKLFIGNRK